MNSLLSNAALHELMEIARRAPPGDLVEVGVYRGGSANALNEVAKEQARRLFLFDTFEGMPYADPVDHHKVGDFADTTIEEVRAQAPLATIVVGVFPLTLDADVGPIAVAHVDCDQYASVKACCDALAPRMVPGGVMVFDDYGILEGATQAVHESFAGRVELSQQGKARVRF